MPHTSITASLGADVAAFGTASVAGLTWITQVNDILQLVATAVAIVAGIGATLWHRERRLALRDERRRKNEKEKRNEQSN